MSRRLGNLIQNGGFELGLIAWKGQNTLSVKGNSHTGSFRALLGGNSELESSLSQDIRAVRKRFYILSFFACAENSGTGEGPGDLHVNVVWLDKKGNELGLALGFDVPGTSLCQYPNWSYYIELSGKAPEETKFARLTLTKDSGGLISLDDILFYEQERDK